MYLLHTCGYWSQPLDPHGSSYAGNVLHCLRNTPEDCTVLAGIWWVWVWTQQLQSSPRNHNSHVKKKQRKEMFPCHLMINQWLGEKYFRRKEFKSSITENVHAQMWMMVINDNHQAEKPNHEFWIFEWISSPLHRSIPLKDATMKWLCWNNRILTLYYRCRD